MPGGVKVRYNLKRMRLGPGLLASAVFVATREVSAASFWPRCEDWALGRPLPQCRFRALGPALNTALERDGQGKKNTKENEKKKD